MSQLLTAEELSSFLKVHPITVYKLSQEGQIPSIKRKGLGLRFKMEEIEEWLKQGSSKSYHLLEASLSADLALDDYDRLFLCKKGGVKVSPKGKTWNYPFGSVYLRQLESGKGTWYIYYRVNGTRHREAVKNAPSRADALKVLQIKVADAFRMEHGFKTRAKRVRFREFSLEYLEAAKVTKRSWRDDKYRLDKLMKFWGSMYLDEIGVQEIERFRVMKLKEGVTKSTINRYCALLKRLFNIAIEYGYANDNPLKRVKFFPEKDNLKERILTGDEEQKLLLSCRNHLRPIVVIALNTGMRRGEIFDLRWSQVDLSRRTIRVERTKSGKVRIIPVNDAAYALLSELSMQKRKSDHVFFNPRTGRPFTDIKRAFSSALQKAGIKGLRFHDLRHTFASRLVEKGVDLITVRDLLGHHSVQMTERYSHSLADQKRRAVEKLDADGKSPGISVPNLSTQIEGLPANALFSVN